MDAVILAGGLGTRLAQTVPYVPKGLAPIQGVPFLKILLKQLRGSGVVSQIILAVGHRAPEIQEALQKENVLFSVETSPLDTGGAFLKASRLTRSSSVLVLNGDSYCDLSLADFLQFHQMKQADITIACTRVEDSSRYGQIETNAQDQIVAFREKEPSRIPGWISAGLYWVQMEKLSHLPIAACSFEKDLFPLFLQKKLYAYPHQGTFIDIGTAKDYFRAQTILE